MAIARVRIAPVDRWCEGAIEQAKRNSIPYEIVVGMEVEILTGSMTNEQFCCTGRSWELTDRSSKEMDSMMGLDWIPACAMLCEHILEMD
jgi:hypothetical protein